jgi:hypothetical protein
MLATFYEIEPLLIIGIGIAIVGSILGILWYRTYSPSDFDKGSALFIIKIFSAIGAGTVILGWILKH